MAANEQMHVVVHDGCRIARIPARRNDLPTRLARGLPFGVVKPNNLVFEQGVNSPPKRLQLFPRRLRAFASQVHCPRFAKPRLFHFTRKTPPRVVRQPMPVARENQVVGDDGH